MQRTSSLRFPARSSPFVGGDDPHSRWTEQENSFRSSRRLCRPLQVGVVTVTRRTSLRRQLHGVSVAAITFKLRRRPQQRNTPQRPKAYPRYLGKGDPPSARSARLLERELKESRNREGRQKRLRPVHSQNPPPVIVVVTPSGLALAAPVPWYPPGPNCPWNQRKTSALT